MKLPDSWKTGELWPRELGRALMRHLGKHSAVLRYGEKWWIVRYLDSGRGEYLTRPNERTGQPEAYENPRPWTRPLEVLGVGESLDECVFILNGGRARAMLGAGWRPRLDGRGEWTGQPVARPSQLAHPGTRDARKPS